MKVSTILLSSLVTIDNADATTQKHLKYDSPAVKQKATSEWTLEYDPNSVMVPVWVNSKTGEISYENPEYSSPEKTTPKNHPSEVQEDDPSDWEMNYDPNSTMSPVWVNSKTGEVRWG